MSWCGELAVLTNMQVRGSSKATYGVAQTFTSRPQPTQTFEALPILSPLASFPHERFRSSAFLSGQCLMQHHKRCRGRAACCFPDSLATIPPACKPEVSVAGVDGVCRLGGLHVNGFSGFGGGRMPCLKTGLEASYSDAQRRRTEASGFRNAVVAWPQGPSSRV